MWRRFALGLVVVGVALTGGPMPASGAWVELPAVLREVPCNDFERLADMRATGTSLYVVAGSCWPELFRLDGERWISVAGNVPVSSSPVLDVALTTIDDVPYVASVSFGTGMGLVRVARIDATGTAWELVGGDVVNETGDARQVEIVGIDGVPYVAWTAVHYLPGEIPQYDVTRVHVARLSTSGSGWEEIAGPVESGKVVGEPVSLTAVAGRPHVAFTADRAAGYAVRERVFVARLDITGTGWEQLAGTGTVSVLGDDAFASSTVRLVAVAGEPWVLWTDSPDDSGMGAVNARIAHLSSGTWHADPPAGLPVAPDRPFGSLAAYVDLIDAPGGPWAYWNGWNGGSRLIRHTAAGWEDVGPPLPLAAAETHFYAGHGLALFGGLPHVSRMAPGDYGPLRLWRLEPDLLGAVLSPTGSGARFELRVRDWGLPVRVGIEAGSSVIGLSAVAAGELVVLAAHGLDLSRSFEWRPFWVDAHGRRHDWPARPHAGSDDAPAGPTPPVGATPSGPSGFVPSRAADRAARRLIGPLPRRLVARDGIVSVPLTCRRAAAGACRGSLRILLAQQRRDSTGRWRIRYRLVGNERFAIPAGTTARLPVRLWPRALRLLERRRLLETRVVVRVGDDDHQQGRVTAQAAIVAPR